MKLIKQFLVLLPFFIFNNATNGQNNPNANKIEDSLTIFGNWRWISGSDTLEILIKPYIEASGNKNDPGQNLIKEQKVFAGWHRFIQKRNFIEGSTSFLNSDLQSGHFTHASILGYVKNKHEYVITSFKDFTTNRTLTGSIILLPNDPQKGILTLTVTPDFQLENRNRDFPFQFLTIPSNIVIQKY